ncbi:Transcriptional regulator, TetR family,putative [Streptococcus sp. HSISM1]|nr:Transcriptional regulator, TetR family,putative [Streptococcus sp. HSISM1]
MAERKISEKSLENLKRFNRENNAITRESIEISLLQLLEKKDLKKITISELVQRAGVSRAAFYRNYDSKEEILESIFQSSIAKITKSLDGYNFKTDLYQVWVYLFKEVKKEAKIISLAIDYNFERLLTKAVYDFLENEMVAPRMALPATSIPSGAQPLSLSSPNGSRMA